MAPEFGEAFAVRLPSGAFAWSAQKTTELFERSTRARNRQSTSAIQRFASPHDSAAAVGVVFGGVDSQGERPEAIRVAVLAAIRGEADVAGFGDFLFDGPQVGTDERIVWDAEGAVLEGGTDRVSE